ncbi:MAG: hypothetical protein AAF135_16910, partial [Bacteroidota bacterium]
VKFVRQDAAYQMEVTVNNGNSIFFEAYTPADYSQEDLNDFVGDYFSDELDCFYRIRVKEETLILQRPRLEDIELKAFKNDVFLADLWYLREVRFVRDTEGRVDALLVSGERVNELAFSKR